MMFLASFSWRPQLSAARWAELYAIEDAGARAGDCDHENDDLYRGSARDLPPQGAAGVLRIRRWGLLFRTNAECQPRRSRTHQAAAEDPRRRLQAEHAHHHPRRTGVAALGAGADRALRHAVR